MEQLNLKIKENSGEDIYHSLTMFQSTLRNVALFTSLSLALLGYSRYYRKNGNKLYNIAFILISIASLTIAIQISHVLKKGNDIKLKYLDEKEVKFMKDLLKIYYYVKYLLYSILGFTIYTLFKQLKKNRIK